MNSKSALAMGTVGDKDCGGYVNGGIGIESSGILMKLSIS